MLLYLVFGERDFGSYLAMLSGLLLALCSGVTPGGALENLWDPRDPTQLGKHLTSRGCAVSPAPRIAKF